MQVFPTYCLVALLLLSSTAVAGGVYRWTDAEGRVHFGDAPPEQQAAESITLQYNTMAALPAEQQRAQVVMYSATWCGICAKAKAFLQARDVPFTEYDIEKTAQGRADYRRLQGSGVPIILVGEERLNGFRASALMAALQRAGHLPARP